jgi:hypothetical protein
VTNVEKHKVNKIVTLVECSSINKYREESFSEIQIAGEREKTINAATNTKKMTTSVMAEISILNLIVNL